MGEALKGCRKCGKDKPLADFYSNGRGKLQPNCKLCHRASARDSYHKSHPGSLRMGPVVQQEPNSSGELADDCEHVFGEQLICVHCGGYCPRIGVLCGESPVEPLSVRAVDCTVDTMTVGRGVSWGW